jgi:branched-chain amino acid transport system ATP-binding protein
VILEIENIHCYYGLSHVVHGASLQVDSGEIVSLLGRNGAGKTTIIGAVMGLVESRSGQIRVADNPVTGLPPHQVCRHGVGWVPQGRRIFPHLTVEENIRLATLKPARTRGFDAFERIYTLFPILHTRGGVLAGGLSGGEQQMLAVARALVGNPRILLLDEPTEGLSAFMVDSLMKAIREIASHGVAVLLAEQNVRMALATAGRHYVLDKGEIRVAMTTSEIENREDLLIAHLGVAARRGGGDTSPVRYAGRP